MDTKTSDLLQKASSLIVKDALTEVLKKYPKLEPFDTYVTTGFVSVVVGFSLKCDVGLSFNIRVDLQEMLRDKYDLETSVVDYTKEDYREFRVVIEADILRAKLLRGNE